jgi:hypothetical protein
MEMSKIICRICGHKKEYHYEKEPVDDKPLPDIGCIQCNKEYRACPGFSREIQQDV